MPQFIWLPSFIGIEATARDKIAADIYVLGQGLGIGSRDGDGARGLSKRIQGLGRCKGEGGGLAEGGEGGSAEGQVSSMAVVWFRA